jgi:hypothetical protein
MKDIAHHPFGTGVISAKRDTLLEPFLLIAAPIFFFEALKCDGGMSDISLSSFTLFFSSPEEVL